MIWDKMVQNNYKRFRYFDNNTYGTNLYDLTLCTNVGSLESLIYTILDTRYYENGSKK